MKEDEEGGRWRKKDEEGGRRRVTPVGVSTSSHVTRSTQLKGHQSKYTRQSTPHSIFFLLYFLCSLPLPLLYVPPWDANRLRIDDTGPTPPTARSRPLREGDESSIAVSTADGAD